MGKDLSRRRVLRGAVGGTAVTVTLPFLDCFLNGNGTALASGEIIPTRFGTWFWGLGMNKSIFVPKTTGQNWQITEEMQSLKDIQKHINVLTNFTAFRDNYENLCHYTGWIISRTGMAPSGQADKPGETLDVSVSNQIGRTTRYKSLTVTATGDARSTYSYENANSPNSPEVSPLAFYTRIFGPDFQDPNATTFVPNPKVMVRKSVLSIIKEEINDLMTIVGAEDKYRIEQYFSGIRHLEQQLDMQLTKPDPRAACVVPGKPKQDPEVGGEAQLIALRHKLMTDILVMAIACDQTRVFNMSYSNSSSNTTKAGYEKPHHTCTHEEPVDAVLGYQPTASWFTRRSMESWAYFVDAFSKVKEGDGTLLDHCLIYASSDHGYARIHSLDGMAMFTAGKASGKMKTGFHIDGGGTSVARMGYTALKTMGVNIQNWGTKSNLTNKEIGEILV